MWIVISVFLTLQAALNLLGFALLVASLKKDEDRPAYSNPYDPYTGSNL